MKCINVDVVKVQVLNDYVLKLEFDNGSKGIVDISKIIPFKGVFEPLKDKKYFSRVAINAEIGTICWENGADISPGLLLENIKPDSKK